jgi:hypothetical protein
MKFLSVLASSAQLRVRSAANRVALALASAFCAAIGIAFATYALFRALEAQYGVINASIGLSAIYFILALILYLFSRRVGLAPRVQSAFTQDAASAIGEADALKANMQSAASSQAAALALGAEFAKQLTPLQLAMLSALSGFVAGRRL